MTDLILVAPTLAIPSVSTSFPTQNVGSSRSCELQPAAEGKTRSKKDREESTGLTILPTAKSQDAQPHRGMFLRRRGSSPRVSTKLCDGGEAGGRI